MVRELPPPLPQILSLDKSITKKVCDAAYSMFPSLNTSGRTYMKGLEISCHGIPWFAVTLISIYLFRSTGAREVEINLFLGLIYDVMIIAFIKSLTRRARPPGARTEDMFVTRGVDKFSFPSGHCSRAVWATLFFTSWAFPDMSIIFVFPLFFLGWFCLFIKSFIKKTLCFGCCCWNYYWLYGILTFWSFMDWSNCC